MSAHIDRLWPEPAADLSDDDLVAAHAYPQGRTWVRMNFVASIDGAVTREGRSGGLGDEADRRVFDLLRRPAHVVLVGAGTVRIEGYDAMRLDEASAAWRLAHGLPPHPVLAVVTRSLDLDPASPLFREAPVRPIVYTVSNAPSSRREALEAVADVVTAGEGEVDPMRVRADLAARGHERIHSEGGPSLLGTFLAARAVDELCLTVAPTVESGGASRIVAALDPDPTRMRLVSVLKSADELFLRYETAEG